MARVVALPSIPVIILIAIALAGCGDDDSVSRYDGQTVDQWIAQARQGNAPSRMAALQALRAFHDNKEALALLEQTLSNDAAPFPERMVAAQSLYRATRDSNRVVPKVGDAIRRQAELSAGAQYPTKELEDLVFWLESSAKPLKPDIEYARSRLNPRTNPAAPMMKARFDSILSDISKT